MPHCIIEYTRDIEQEVDIKHLLDVAFDAVNSAGLFDRASIKARAIGYDMYRSGQSRNDYIHIDLKILSGRTPEQKKALSDHMIDTISPHIGRTKSFTVDVIDMDIVAYGKSILPDD